MKKIAMSLKRISNGLNVSPDELIDWTIKEDRRFLQALNLSALTFIFFPLLGIIVPLILWVSKKDKLKDVNKIGKDIINFEITWTILLFLIPIILNSIMIATAEVPNMRGIIITSLISFTFMYLLNFVFIIFNTLQIHNEKDVKYYPKIRFL